MTDLSDVEFLARFADCSLPASAFDHLGHLRMAWLHLQRQPLAEAVEAICGGIERFATHLNVPQKYNRTLSEALVVLMAAGGATDRTVDWVEWQARNAELVGDARGVLARHYSDERLTSPDARTRFVVPDRAPLPLR